MTNDDGIMNGKVLLRNTFFIPYSVHTFYFSIYSFILFCFQFLIFLFFFFLVFRFVFSSTTTIRCMMLSLLLQIFDFYKPLLIPLSFIVFILYSLMDYVRNAKLRLKKKKKKRVKSEQQHLGSIQEVKRVFFNFIISVL